MDEETFHELLHLINVYVDRELGLDYFSVLQECTINDERGLQAIWTTRDEHPSITIGAENDYKTHSAYVFGENKPVWVVNLESGDAINVDAKCVDRWIPAADNLPRYQRKDMNVKTSVMHPLRQNGLAFGVLEFASEKRVEPTPTSLEEITTLAAVIEKAYQMSKVFKAHQENRANVMRSLSEALANESWTRLALPKVFVASVSSSQNTTSNRPV